jgi:hypothetical protein
MDTAPASIVVSLAAPWRFRGNALCALSQAASAETSRTCRGQDAARIVMVAAAASKRIVCQAELASPDASARAAMKGRRSPACWPDSRLWHVLSRGSSARRRLVRPSGPGLRSSDRRGLQPLASPTSTAVAGRHRDWQVIPSPEIPPEENLDDALHVPGLLYRQVDGGSAH